VTTVDGLDVVLQTVSCMHGATMQWDSVVLVILKAQSPAQSSWRLCVELAYSKSQLALHTV